MSVLGYERLEVPKDENGIPLPIIPSENFPDDIHSERLSKHHEYFLQGAKKFRGPGPVAVRGSRIIRVERVVHNQGSKAFHRFYDFSPVPSDEESKFEVSFLNAAGYMPKRGIDLWSGEPIERELEDGEFDILTAISGAPDEDDLRYKNLIYYTDDLRPFYDKFLQGKNLATIPPDLMMEFIHAERSIRRQELGSVVIESLVEAATASVAPIYAQARMNGQLHPNAPEEPAKLLLRLLGGDERHERLLKRRWRKLVDLSLQSRVKVVSLQT